MIHYPLSALLEIADRGFKTLFGGFDFWGTAEILKLQQKGKYVYAEMVEYDAEGKICAKMKGIIFDEFVYQKFLAETKLRNINEMTGLKILFHGRFSFHKDYGFSIIIDELSAEFTLGHMQKKQDEILETLKALGISDKNRMLERGMPSYTLAVISADGAAGLKDFYTVLGQSGYKISYTQYLCAMHGNNAVEAVQQQLGLIRAALSAGEKIDGVVIVRGGGESSGIAWQNDLEIAKSICMMPVPVITAIGHTQDRFILQDISWYGAKTPTDAAYRISALYVTWEDCITMLYEGISEMAQDHIQGCKEHLEERYRAIQQMISFKLHDIRTHVTNRFSVINAASPERILQHGYALLLQNSNYLDTIAVNNLSKDDTLQIKIYDKIIDVRVTDIRDNK